MLYARTENERALEGLFERKGAGAGPLKAGGTCLVLLYYCRADCDLVLADLGERGVAYLPPEWYEAATVERHQTTQRHDSISEYLSALIGSFADTVAVPVVYSEFFALIRLGLFEPVSSDTTFAILARRRSVDEAAAAFVSETGIDKVDVDALSDEAFAWLLERSYTVPQEREIVRNFLETRRSLALDMRIDQCRMMPNTFYDRLIKKISVVGQKEPDEARDANRRNLETKIGNWMQDRFATMLGEWQEHGWPEPAEGADALAPTDVPEPSMGREDAAARPDETASPSTRSAFANDR